MHFASSAFSDGDVIPKRFTCDGENLSPPLHWSDPPAGTHSFAVLCDDPDAPSGTWRHWAIYDLPANNRGLPEGAGRRGGENDSRQAANDFGQAAYGGPCPPRGHGPHHYRFRLLALSCDRLAVGPAANCRDVDRQARKHIIAESVLVAIYQR